MKLFKCMLIAATATFGVLLANAGAQASTDQGCVPGYRSLSSKFNCDVVGMLMPQNDTRDNLIFLLADRRQQKLVSWPEALAETTYEDAAYGEGTICVSATAGSAAFQSAVMADAGIPPEEKTQLVAARLLLKCAEGEASTPLPVVTAQSPNGQAFLAYLKAIERFYRIDFADNAPFAALHDSAQPWVREAATYMQARTLLLAAQKTAVGEFGDFDPAKADKDMAIEARNALNGYLLDYPNGTYAKSARGLLRRAAWFLADPVELGAVYSNELANSSVDAAGIAIANEIDLKLPLQSYTDPKSDLILLAVQDLRLLRPEFDDNGKPFWTMQAAFLEAQRSRFAGQERLFDYLLALRAFVVDKDAKAVLTLLQDPLPTSSLDYVGFSRHMLRARAMAMNGDASLRDYYLALLPHATQLYQRSSLEWALAVLDEKNKNISAVFAEGSPITDPDIRIQLLDHVAGPIILKQQATSATASQDERNAALYRLLARDLKQGRFKGFLEDVKLLPPIPAPDADGYVNDRFEPFRWKGGNDDGYACPGIVDVASRMAANPKDITARLCLGDFLRVNYIEEPYLDNNEDLGATGTIFAGAEIARQDYYRDIMKSPKASRKDRAYALFRAVNCYAPIGNNACGGTDVSKSQRKAWYTELKTKYADTDWAKKLQYYW